MFPLLRNPGIPNPSLLTALRVELFTPTTTWPFKCQNEGLAHLSTVDTHLTLFMGVNRNQLVRMKSWIDKIFPTKIGKWKPLN